MGKQPITPRRSSRLSSKQTVTSTIEKPQIKKPEISKKVFKPLEDETSNKYGLFNKGNDEKLNLLMNGKTPKIKRKRITDPFIEPGAIHQMDLLFLPEDHGYKYLLTVIDVGSRMIDGFPLKDKKPKSIIQGLNQIYKKSPYLTKPTFIKSDSGKEFNNQDVKAFLKKEKIGISFSHPGVHYQTGLVERSVNLLVGKAIFYAQNSKELKTKKPNTEWIGDIDDIILIINSSRMKNIPQRLKKARELALKAPIADQTDVNEILNLGDIVYHKAHQPYEAYNPSKKLPGNFRAGDLKFAKKKHKITNISFAPGQPILYSLSGVDNKRYTRDELLLLKDKHK